MSVSVIDMQTTGSKQICNWVIRNRGEGKQKLLLFNFVKKRNPTNQRIHKAFTGLFCVSTSHKLES